MNSDRSHLLALSLGCWTETRNSLTSLSSYRSQVNNRKYQTGSRNVKPLYFWVSHILTDKTYDFVQKPDTKHFVPVSCKLLQKFYTGSSSYWSEFILVKYPLTVWRTLATYHQPMSSLTSPAFGDASAKGVTAAVYAVVHQDLP